MESQGTDWLPLLIAVLGIVGTLGGVWYGGYRQEKLEDKRWQREKDERQRLHNLEDRKATYVEFLSILHPMTIWASGLWMKAEPPPDVESFWTSLGQNEAKMRLLCDEAATKEAYVMTRLLRSIMANYKSLTTAEFQERYEELMSARQRVIRLIREDVGA